MKQDLIDQKWTLFVLIFFIQLFLIVLAYNGYVDLGIYNQKDIFSAILSLKRVFQHGLSEVSLELVFFVVVISSLFEISSSKIENNEEGKRSLKKVFLTSVFVIVFACSPVSLELKDWIRSQHFSAHLDSKSNEADISVEQLMDKAVEVTYDELARYPENYDGIALKLKGQVEQVLDGAIRVSITEKPYIWTDSVYVSLKGEAKDARLLDGDIVYILGLGANKITYRGLYDQAVTVPHVKGYGISRAGFSNMASPSGVSIEEVAIRSVYGNYDGHVRDDSEKGKLITGAAWTVTGAQENVKSWNGANVVVVPNLTKYFTENGIKKALVVTNTVISENGVKVACHTCGSIVGAIILKQQDGKWKEISHQRILTIDGSWGDPPSISADLLESAVILHIESSFMNQGFVESSKYDITYKNSTWKVGEVSRESSGGGQ